MQEHQYRWTLKNRRSYAPRGLFDTAAEASGVLRVAARGLRRRQRATSALERLLPGQWLAGIRVECERRDTVILAVSDPAIAERLRRRSAQLQKSLSATLGGLARLEIRESAPRQSDGGDAGMAWS